MEHVWHYSRVTLIARWVLSRGDIKGRFCCTLRCRKRVSLIGSPHCSGHIQSIPYVTLIVRSHWMWCYFS